MLLDFYSLDCYLSKLGRESREFSFVTFCTVNGPQAWVAVPCWSLMAQGIASWGQLQWPEVWLTLGSDFVNQQMYFPNNKEKDLVLVPACASCLLLESWQLCPTSCQGQVLFFIPKRGRAH